MRRRSVISWGLFADNLIEAFDNLVHFGIRHMSHALAQSLYGKRSDLTDLHPGRFREGNACDLHGQREARPLWLTCKSHGDHRAGAIIEYLRAEDQCRA